MQSSWHLARVGNFPPGCLAQPCTFGPYLQQLLGRQRFGRSSSWPVYGQEYTHTHTRTHPVKLQQAID